VVADSVPGFAGPLAGILVALSWMPSATHVLTVPADTPFLPHDLAARLRAAVQGPDDSVMVARQGRLHPVIGLWPVSSRDRLEMAVRKEGLRKVEAWTDRVSTRVVSFDEASADPFFNVNTADDLAAARDRLAVNA
jgi:molybdopterin-guanine dinucleotide biosynthesis protein A